MQDEAAPDPKLLRRLKTSVVEIDECLVPDDDPNAIEFVGFLYLADALWRVGGRLTRHRATGVLTLSGLSLRAVSPRDTPVTVRLLHRVPITRLIAAAVGWLRENAKFDLIADAYGIPEPAAFRGERAHTRRAAKVAASSKLPLGVKPGALPGPPLGWRGTPVEFHDQVAVQAVEAAALGRPVVGALGELYGRPERTIKRWIKEARDVGSLDSRPRAWTFGPRFDREEEQ